MSAPNHTTESQFAERAQKLLDRVFSALRQPSCSADVSDQRRQSASGTPKSGRIDPEALARSFVRLQRLAKYAFMDTCDQDFVDAHAMLAELREDNLKLVEGFRVVKDAAEEAKDNATSGIVDEWIVVVLPWEHKLLDLARGSAWGRRTRMASFLGRGSSSVHHDASMSKAQIIRQSAKGTSPWGTHVYIVDRAINTREVPVQG